MSAAEEAEFCDGVKLMAWLREVEPRLWAETGDLRGNTGNVNGTIGPNWNRRFYDWDRGSCPSVYTVDKLMVALGRHLLEIPDECFVEKREYKESPERRWKRETALRLVEEGHFQSEAARAVGVTRRVVAGWLQKQRAA